MLGIKKTDSITIKDVPAEAFIKALAEQLKVEQKVTPLSGDEYIKTGIAKEVSP
jgi:ribosomal protein S19E (S16A)